MGVSAFGKARGKQLATLGYHAFVADIYGNGKVAADAKEAGSLSGSFKADRPLTRKRAEAALQELLKDPKVDKTKIGAIGFCFGGLVGLELVRAGASVNGLVSFHGGLDTPAEYKAKKITGKILALHGADDPFVKTEDVTAFEDEMRRSGATWELVKYGGAVHSFTNPDAGTDNSKGAAYNPLVAKRAYEAMDDFFKEVFAN
jgi:dienelactone hydrolase